MTNLIFVKNSDIIKGYNVMKEKNPSVDPQQAKIDMILK